MEERAVGYLGEGCNCAQCLLMASGEAAAARMCEGVSRGFGFGGFCGALIGAALALRRVKGGNVKQAALGLFSEFHERFGAFECALLLKGNGGECNEIIRFLARGLEDLLD
jgi:hypothetical protein